MKYSFVETLSFQQMVKYLFMEVTVHAPEPPLRFCDCVVLPGVIAPGLVQRRRGAESLHAVAPKER